LILVVTIMAQSSIEQAGAVRGPGWSPHENFSDYFHRVEHEAITASCLEGISDLRTTTELDLSLTCLSDDALEYVAAQSQIRALILEACDFSDEGMRHIGRMTSLESLSLKNSGLTDAALVHLTRLSELLRLDLSETHISDEGVGRLAELTQ